MLNRIKYLCFAIIVSQFFSLSAMAASIWAVASGDPANSNSAGNTLLVNPGTTSLDLYFDTQGDTSFGWDLSLNVTGTGTISNVTGAFVAPADGQALVNGGWMQIGGDAVGESGSELLILSLDFTASAGALIDLLGSYTDGIFMDTALSSPRLAEVAPVPLPAGFLLFGSALSSLLVLRRRNRKV